MKKNKNTYILLAVAIIVWGLIGYKVLKAVKPNIPKLAQIPKLEKFKPFEITKKETFKIAVDYRDPFLGTYTTNRKTTKKSIRKKEKSIVKTQPFPTIIYKGLISPKNRKDKHFIVIIKGKTYLFKKLDTNQEVQLKSGDAKEIVLSYKGEEKTIQIK